MLDTNGSAVSGMHDLTFRIFTDVFSGSMIWEETIGEDFVNGYYAVILGGDIQNNPIDDSILAQYPLYLEIEVDNNGPLSELDGQVDRCWRWMCTLEVDAT